MRGKTVFFSLLLLLGGGFFAASAAERYSHLEIFARALGLIKKHYFRPVEMKTLVYGAVKGLLRDIDPHSRFLPPEELKKVKEEIIGKFYGVGIEVERLNGALTVVFVVKNSPAEKAGFKQGDQIFKANEKTVRDATVWEFSDILKKGGEHKIFVYRPDVRKFLTLEVKPSVIKISSVLTQKLPAGALYARIYYFSRTTFLEFNKALRAFPPRGLILDLRSSPGGVFEQAIQVTDLFLDEGVIVSHKAKAAPKPEIFYAGFSDTLPSFPIVVLINEYSASASEILAGALKDHKRAKIMGRKSFGKGSVQSIFYLPGGSAIKLTVGEYQTPSGQFIHGRGIEPHIFIGKRPRREKAAGKAAASSVLNDFEAALAFKELKKMIAAQTAAAPPQRGLKSPQNGGL